MISVVKDARGRYAVLSLLCLVALAGCGSSSTDSSSNTSGYTVAGTVSGLNGSVRLKNNGDDDLILNTNTSFAFSTRLSSGDAYRVTAHDEPANQVCSVSNGSGSVGSANISNVQITCSTVPTYSVGGTISGLTAGAVVLQNDSVVLKDNNGDDIDWGNGGFSVQVGDTKNFSISVYNKPANHTCTVTNGSGTVNGGPINNIGIACVMDAWNHPASLADNISPDGQDAISPQVAMDDNGEAVVVWAQSNGSNSQIYMREYRAGAWSAVPDLVTGTFSATGSDAHTPQVAMDNNGNAIVVWLQESAGEDRVYRKDYRAGSWDLAQTEVSPNPLANRHAEDPRVAMDDNNNAIIVWRQPDGVGQPQLFMSDYNLSVATTWTNPADNNDNFSPDGNEVRFPPDVAMSASRAVVVWRQYSGTGSGQFRVYMRDYNMTAAGTWSAVPTFTQHINPAGTGGVSGAQVAMDDSGNAIVVWDQANPEPQPHPYFPGANPVYIQQIFKSEYRGAVWAHPANLLDNISPDELSAANPMVAMDNNGNAIITWLQSDSSRDLQLFKSEYRLSAWTHPSSLSDNFSPDGMGVTRHSVAMDDNDDAIIAWLQFDGTRLQTYKSEYRVSVWNHPVSLADSISPGTNAAVLTGPDVTMNNAGDALILWSQADAETAPLSTQIFMSRLGIASP